VTVAAAAVFVGVTLVAFGPQPWGNYVSKTLPVLSDLERNGSGAFTAMIPSVFMTMRILTGDPQLAQWVHLAAAAIVVVTSGWCMLRTSDRLRQSAILLAAGALVTPYIHIYDLAGVVAAGLLCLGAATRASIAQIAAGLAVAAAWGLPMITLAGNEAGIPVGPVILVGVFIVAAWPRPRVAVA
jgi:hypothetical protein